MRFLIIILLILPILAFSQTNQTDSDGLRQGLWKKQQSNGRPLYEGNFKDGKPVGEWKRYHKNGVIKAIINYHETSDTAFTQLFDEIGKKVAEGVYFNQKKEGNWIYYSGRKKISEEHYKLGLKNGVSKKYYDSGELMEEAEWVNDRQHGNYQVFFKNGKPYMKCKLSYGKRNGLCLVHFQNGTLEMEAKYENDLRDGEWRYYNSEGQLRYTLHYKLGELLNPAVKDSIASIKMQNFENAKGQIVDPEKFMQDPSEYMRKMNIYK